MKIIIAIALFLVLVLEPDAPAPIRLHAQVEPDACADIFPYELMMYALEDGDIWEIARIVEEER